MIKEKRIEDFEKTGLGMFVHFGIYSLYGKGEWARYSLKVPEKEYEALAASFDPEPDWAEKLVLTAKKAGCGYITLTARHHDGFSLYDTKGLSDFDAMHAKCSRDLIKEYVDACNKYGITPFFYHTLLDWHMSSYNDDFPAYIDYLVKSVEILCTNYGKIGGIWFDGMWNKKSADWQEDRLYSTIRKHQPDAIIINNTGLDALGEPGHHELDSVTFERGRPKEINREGAKKYVASEMCDIFAKHWGYAREDFAYKGLSEIIENVCLCRKYGSNYLINAGPEGNGYLRPLDRAMLETLGEWTALYDGILHLPASSPVPVKGAEKSFAKICGDTVYVFRFPGEAAECAFEIPDGIAFKEPESAALFDDPAAKIPLSVSGGRVSVTVPDFPYGKDHVVRVAVIR